MTWVAEQTKHILVNFNNHQLFMDKNKFPDGSAAPLDYVTPDRVFFKGGLEMEKC